MNRNLAFRRSRLLAGGVSLALLSCGASYAQDTTDQIESVTVTGQKVSQDLQRSALAVTALSGATLDQQNITSAKDLDAVAPGLVVNSTPSNPLSVTIRGAGYEGIQNNSAQPSVSFNENGVYISNPIGLGSTFLDVKQLEVLRGPQGTVLGQNSDGGALNITTVKPILGEYSGSADVSLGTYALDRVRLIGNLPIGDDMALRGAFQQEKHNGFSQATGVAGQPAYQLGDENSLNGRLDYLWNVTQELTWEVWGEFYINNSNGDAFKNIHDPNPDPYKLTQDYPATIREASDVISARASYDLGWATVNAIGSYQHGKLYAAEGLDKLDYDTAIAVYGVHDIAPINSRLGNSQTEEIDMVSAPGGDFDWIVGVFAIQQSYDETFLEYQYNNRNAVLPPTIADPGAVFATGFLAFESTDTQELNSSSIYAQGTYHISDDLRVTVGARGTFDNQLGLVSTYFDPAVSLVAKYKAVTGKVEAEYDLTPSSMIYLMGSTGIKPGGANLNPGAVVVPEVFKPENNSALELGSKNQFFDNRLRVNLAAYYNHYRDFQADSEDPIPYLGGLTNIGKMDTYGLEGEITALLPYNLRLDANFSVMGGKVLSHQQMFDPEVAQNIDRANGGPFNGNDVADRYTAFYAPTGDIYGRTPPKLPPFTTTIGLTHTLEFGDDGVLTTNFNFTYRDPYFFRIYNNPGTDKLPPLTQLNLGFMYDFPADDWHLALLITNLADKASVNSRYTDNFGVGAVADGYVAPRQFIVRVGRTF